MEGNFKDSHNGSDSSDIFNSDNLFMSLEIDTELWSKAQDAKKRFLEKGDNPIGLPYVPIEVAESWIRSKKLRVDPYMEKPGYELDFKDFEDLLKKKAKLIETVAVYLKRFLPILTDSGYVISLTDENGVTLLLEGADKDIEAFNKIGIKLSTSMSEASVGTNAHSLCISQRKSIQIIGPYNYYSAFQNNISSATPIFDEKNNVIGALAVVQMLAPKDLNHLQSHSLGWMIAMGYAIENLLKAKNRNYNLSVSNGILETTLSVIDEGMVTVNQDGYISHINREGANIFGVSVRDIINKPYKKLLNAQQKILVAKILKGDSPVQNIETVIESQRGQCPYLMDIKPVFNNEYKDSQGVVIRLVRAEKVNRMAANIGGATAAYRFEDILGSSLVMEKTIEAGKKLSKTGFNVLLIGESGTGKELFAQAIHNEYRPEGPFVAINCASMPRNLIESELFGYEGGAFTGAERRGRPGKIELANGGTLFLDEIGDMPLEIQPVLLRVLEDKKVMRVGGSRYIPVDFRVIAATNKGLPQMIQEKTFRADLYYRLSTFKLTIPPLRNRGEDILFLALHFIEDISAKLHCPPPQLSAEAREKIRGYDWPGNVRQLQNAMVYATNMAQDGVIQLSNLPEDIVGNTNNVMMEVMPLAEMEKAAIVNAMKVTGNNKAEAAKLLGVGRTTIYEKLKEYGMDL